MRGHRRSGGTEQLMGPEVTGVEQHEEFLVVGTRCGVGQDEGFQLRLSCGPVLGAMAEESVEIVEIGLIDLVADLDGPGCVTRLPEQGPEAVPQELVLDRFVAD